MGAPTSLGQIEQHLKTRIYARGIPVLLRRFGTDVKVQRRASSISRTITEDTNVPPLDAIAQATRDVYGVDAGLSPGLASPAPQADQDSGPHVLFDARILLGSATFQAADHGFSSDFEENTCFSFDDLKPGDVLNITRKLTTKQFLIGEREEAGLTDTVVWRYKISPIES